MSIAIEEDDVLVLTDDNFNEVVNDDSFVLVHFYASWSGHCKVLSPEYAKAAGRLKEEKSNIRLGKADAGAENQIAKQFGIQGFPNLKFFKNGTPIDYTGGRTEVEIVRWLNSRFGPPARILSTLDDVQEFLANGDVSIVFFGQKEDGLNNYLLVAEDDYPYIMWGVCDVAEVAAHYKVVAGSALLFNKSDDKQAIMEPGFTEKELEAFIARESVTYVEIFSDETAPRIFGSNIKEQLMLFDTDFERRIDNAFWSAARNLRGRVLPVFVEVDLESNQKVLDFFGVSQDDAPLVYLIDTDSDRGDMTKYQMSGEITEENIEAFVTAFEAGTLEPKLKSEEVPENQSGPVYKLVGKTFHEEIQNAGKAVFVHFYAPWSGHCKQLAPMWDRLGEAMAASNDVVIARMDATANEVADVRIASLPTLKLFQPDGSVISYKGGRTLDDFISFIESGFQEMTSQYL